MTAKKVGKWDLVSLIVAAVLVVSLILVIVGLCITWTSSTLLKQNHTLTITDWLDMNNSLTSKGLDPISGLSVNVAFAIITVIALGLATISYGVSLFVNKKVLKLVTLVLAAVAVAAAIVTLITGYTFVGNFNGDPKDATSLAVIALIGTNCTVAAGPWLVAVFAIVGGAAGIFGSIKK